MSILKLQDEVDRLRDHLVFMATRWLIDECEVKRNDRLRRILINISEILGDTLLITPEIFEATSTSILVEGLRECHLAGGKLSVVLPGTDDEAQIHHLRESGLLSDLRGVDHLIIDGYGAMSWLETEVKQGLSEVRAIDLKVLSDDELLELTGSELFTQLEAGVNDREMRGELSTELMIKLENRFEELGMSDEQRMSVQLVAEHVSSLVVSEINGVEFKMVYCPTGQFWMGSDEEWMGSEMDFEWPECSYKSFRHRVEITQPFLMSQTPVTQAQWEAIMGSNPSHFEGANLPVESMSWFDCVRFCNALSIAEGFDPVYDIGYGDRPRVKIDLSRKGYRLPTDAEWEYMAKASTELTYAGSNHARKVAWYNSNKTHPVGQKKPNHWGIYDCSGNVWEWCSDQWMDLSSRGGGWGYSADYCHVACRRGSLAEISEYFIGFRVLR